MSDISPLQRLLLKFLRNCTLGAAFLLVIFLAITLWQETKIGDFESLSRQDYGFIGVLTIMLSSCFWVRFGFTAPLAAS